MKSGLARRLERLERAIAPAIEADYRDLSAEELDRRIAKVERGLFGDDTAAIETFRKEAMQAGGEWGAL